MSVQDLLDGNFEPFLRFRGFGQIRHVIGDYSRFKSPHRSKGLAVSSDGHTLRMVLKGHGYNDRFVSEDEQCVLSYVCGNPEEQRRQNLNRLDDAMLITLDAPDDRHAVLHGVFKRIEAQRDLKPDDTELLVPRSYITIVGYEDEARRVVRFANVEPAAATETKIARTISIEREHLVFDTESAAPLDRRMLGRTHDPFPILEVAFFRVGSDFKRVMKVYSAVLRYDDALLSKIGNDETTAVLKFSMAELRAGDDARVVLQTVFDEIGRVTATGGMVFAHNVSHDIGQLKATARLLGHPLPEKSVQAVDTVKTASNFVPGAEDRWMKLCDLARLCGLSRKGSINNALHYAADDALLLLDVLRSKFPPDKLGAYREEYTL